MRKRKGGKKRHGKMMPQGDIGTQTLTKIVCIVAVICLIVGGVYIDTFHGKGMLQAMISQTAQEQPIKQESDENIQEQMNIDISSKAAIAVFGKEFMLCTKDGVKYFAGMENQKWNDTFNMTSPVIAQEGEYVAVGDLAGKNVRVYHKNGLLYELQAEGTPVQFALNESGYLSLITKSDGIYRICVYNGKGTLLKERIEESSGIFPLSSDVSDDCEVFAVSYLDTTDISPIGRVVLFYIDTQKSGEYTDSMFAGVEKADELIPVIAYRENGMLAVISDCNIYGIGSDGEELWCYPLENTLDQVAMGNKKYTVLALGDSVADKDGRERGTVCWIDDNGREKDSIETDESVTYLYAAEKGVVIGSGNAYIGATHGGNIAWEYVATADLNDLIPMEKLDRVLLLGKEKASIYTMQKQKGKQTVFPVSERMQEESEEEELQAEEEMQSEETQSEETQSEETHLEPEKMQEDGSQE